MKIDSTFEKELSKRNIPWRCMWEQKVPNIGYITAYLVQERVILHQTYERGHGWQVYLPVESMEIDKTVEEVIAKTKVDRSAA